MNVSSWFDPAGVTPLIVTLALQVTFVLLVTCTVAAALRRQAAARHAVCLAGLLLAIACPLLATQGKALGWTWLHVDWPADEFASPDPDPRRITNSGPAMYTDRGSNEKFRPLPVADAPTIESSPAGAEPITMPPDVLYQPGGLAESPAEHDGSHEITDSESAQSWLTATHHSMTDPSATGSTPARLESGLRLAELVPTIMTAFLTIWLLGVVIHAALWMLGHRRLQEMLRDLVELDPEQFGRITDAVASTTKLRRPVPILVGPRVPIPLVFGLWRPRVLLPADFAESVKPDELRDVLIHECAHVARRDPWISLLQRVAATIYWPHPLVYLMNRQLTISREELCDNHVLQLSKPSVFAEALVALSEQYQPARIPVGLLSLFSRRNRLEARVAGLLNRRRSMRTKLRTAWRVLVSTAAIAVLLSAIGIRASSAPDDPEATNQPGETAASSSSAREQADEDEPADEWAGYRNGFGMAFSPDSGLIAVGAEDRLVRVYRTSTGEQVATLRGHDIPCDVIRFSPDGSELMTGGRKLLVWDTEDWSRIRSVSLDGARSLYDMTGDQERVVGLRDGERTISVWSAVNGEPLSLHELSDTPLSAAFSNDGRRIAVGTIALADGESTGRVLILDSSTLDQLQQFETHPYSVSSLAFSDDDRFLAMGMNWRATVRDLEENREVRRLDGHSGVIESVAFSPDNSLLAVGSEGAGFRHQGGWRLLSEMKLWDLNEGRLLNSSAGELGRVQAVTFSPDGNWLAWSDYAGLTVETVHGGRRAWKVMLGDTQPLLPGAERAAGPGVATEEDTEPKGESVEERAAPEAGDGVGVDATELLERIQGHCDLWINTPGERLRSLEYTYTLGNDEQQVELIRGISEVRRGMWYGSTLGTGLHWLLRHPERFDVTVAKLESEADRIELTIRSKPAEQRIFLEIGNGISGSWRGYFSQPSDEMKLLVDAERWLPLRETHRLISDPAVTEIRYGDWKSVGDDRWVPELVDVEHDGATYHMHFAWQGEAAWLLTYAETEYQGDTFTTARVSNVVVNNEELIRRRTEEERERGMAAAIVRTMLEQNRPWLAGDLSGLESLSYTFHTLREDVKEACIVSDDGTIVMQVTHDGQGKMGERMGERQMALSSGEWARANREDRFALIRDPAEQEDRQQYAEQLRHYGRIGCQFDLPLFRYLELLDGATVEMEDGEWDGTPCRVATVRSLGRDVYLGCGTMLGFTSWSYVHHIRPSYETIYIDQERNVPLHETLVSSRDNKRFEIEFDEYREIEPGQWAPLSIRIESPDYFTCELKFQLVEGRHWMLSEVESWFDPENKSRGVVQDVAVNQSSELLDAALEQIETTRGVFGDEDAGVSRTVRVPTYEFVLGHRRTAGPLDVLFTLNAAGELILRCTPDDGQPIDAGQSVSALLLDEENRLLSAAHTRFAEQDGGPLASASFGRSTALAKVSRYSISLDNRLVENPLSAPGQIRIGPSGDETGKTSIVDVAVRPGEDDHMVAVVHFASQDRMNEFGLDISVGLFNEQGELIAAGAKQGRLMVKSNIVEETWEVPLPELETSDAIDSIAVGVIRGQTYSQPIGSFWGSFGTNYPVFKAETMLAAEDSGCWLVGLQELEQHVRENVLRRGLLDSVRDWKEQVDEQGTHMDALRPHVERLLHIAERSGRPEVLSAAIRLLGLSGDRRAVGPIRRHLESDDSGVGEAAAIALGMLGRGDALARIEAVLNRNAPSIEEDRQAYRGHRTRSDDALIALVTIRNEESIAAVRRHLVEAFDKIESVAYETGGHSWRGTRSLELLAKLMGCYTDPRFVAVLTEAIAYIDSEQPGDGKYSPSEFITSLHEYGDEARAFIDNRVRSGDLSVLPARDPKYVSAMRETMLAAETDTSTLYQGIRYLWNARTDEAIVLLGAVYEERLPEDQATRLYLYEALAYFGDDRGLPEAFELLVAACAPEEPPEDREERRAWERDREDAREDPLDVFERAKSESRIAVVEQHQETDDIATRIACLALLETLRGAMPESMRDSLQAWSDSENEEVATGATLLLQRR